MAEIQKDEIKFDGRIDGFVPPAEFSGWVTKRVNGNLVKNACVEINNSSLLAVVFPSFKRLDVSNDPNIYTGFSIDLERLISLREIRSVMEFVEGTCRFVAADVNGQRLVLKILPRAEEKIRAWFASTKA